MTSASPIMESFPLGGKVALITGGGRGIGREIATLFAKRGAAAVAVTYRSNQAAANATVAQIVSHGTKAMAIETREPMTKETADSILESILEAFSHIDILVNNVGAGILPPFAAITPDIFHETFHTDLLMPILLMQAIIPVIRPYGSIITITSMAARTTLGGTMSLHAASNAALEHLMRNLAVTHAGERNITMNCVAPGPIDTEALRALPSDLIDLIKDDWTSYQRVGKADEVADIVCFLAGGGGARWINGHTIAASGGATMS